MFNTPQKIFRIIAIGFGLIGLGLIGGGFASYRSTEAFLRTAKTATGQVIGYERHTDSEGEISYFPVIVFTPAGGEEIEFTSSTGSGGRGYAIGADVPLRYDPALPFNAQIDSPLDLWIGAAVFGILGVAFTAVGCGMFWFFRPAGPMDMGEPTPLVEPDLSDPFFSDEEFNRDDSFEDEPEQEGDPEQEDDPEQDEAAQPAHTGPQVKVI